LVEGDSGLLRLEQFNMNDPKQGVSEEEVKTPSAPPAEVPEAEQTPEVKSPDQEIETTDLPSEPNKQREAFISMRRSLSEKDKENEELRAKLAEHEAQREAVLREQSVLDNLRAGYTPNLDQITPDTDLETVTSRMTQAEKVAYNSQRDVAQLKKQLADEAMFRVAPELNPDHPDYKKPETKDLEDYIASKLIVEGLSGKDINDPKVIASLTLKYKEKFNSFSMSKKEQIASEAVEQLRQTEQASLDARGGSVVQPKQVDIESLRDKARRGDAEAMAEVLKNTILSE
jgi:hypothetical protein